MSEQEKKWTLRGIIIGIIILIGLLAIFNVGVIVGMKKAEFENRVASQTTNFFPGPRTGMMRGFMGIDAHASTSTIGSISKIDGSTLTIQEKDGTEKSVLINDKTLLRQNRTTMMATDLKTGENIVAFGSTDANGNIVATLIRVDDGSVNIPPASPQPAVTPIKN